MNVLYKNRRHLTLVPIFVSRSPANARTITRRTSSPIPDTAEDEEFFNLINRDDISEVDNSSAAADSGSCSISGSYLGDTSCSFIELEEQRDDQVILVTFH